MPPELAEPALIALTGVIVSAFVAEAILLSWRRRPHPRRERPTPPGPLTRMGAVWVLVMAAGAAMGVVMLRRSLRLTLLVSAIIVGLAAVFVHLRALRGHPAAAPNSG